jgi:hypothetical protein
MRVVRVERHVAVWETSLYDVPVPDHLSDEQARSYATEHVADGAWAPWYVDVGDLVDDCPDRTSAVGPLGVGRQSG